MVGALDATAMELDRVANQMPEDTDFWDVIKAVEYWEHQNAALLTQANPHSAIRRCSAQGTTVLVGNVASPWRDPSIVCTWCSQRGHMEVECMREPRCAICFGDHPERIHGAVVDVPFFRWRGKGTCRGSHLAIWTGTTATSDSTHIGIPGTETRRDRHDHRRLQ